MSFHSWGHKESDTTEGLNDNNHLFLVQRQTSKKTNKQKKLFLFKSYCTVSKICYILYQHIFFVLNKCFNNLILTYHKFIVPYVKLTLLLNLLQSYTYFFYYSQPDYCFFVGHDALYKILFNASHIPQVKGN